jgi:hypothetical protein
MMTFSIKTLLGILILTFLVSCTATANKVPENSKTTKEATTGFSSENSYVINEVNELEQYYYDALSYDDSGATFHLLHKNDKQLFIEYILNHKSARQIHNVQQPSGKEILDSLREKSNNEKFLINVTECCEATATLYTIYKSPPKSGAEYVKGIEWIDVTPDYFRKLFKVRNAMWNNWYDIYYDFSPDLSDWELELIKKDNLDSLGFTIRHPSPPNAELAGVEAYDTTYFYRMYPNRKIPYKSSWNPFSIRYNSEWNLEERYHIVNGDYNGNLGTLFFRDFVDYLIGDVELSYDELFAQFIDFLTKDSCKVLLEASGNKIHFSVPNLIQIDKMYGTDFYSDWSSAQEEERRRKEEPCDGISNCSYEVRAKLENAGWELVGDVIYYGNGVYYALGAKPMETGVTEILYTMDCNCQPVGVKLK